MSTTQPDADRPLRGRRISADEFYKITGKRLKGANDDQKDALTEDEA